MPMNLILAAPEIFLTTAICVVLLVDVFLRDDQRQITYVLSMLALIGTATAQYLFNVSDQAIGFNGSFVADPAGNVLKMFAYVVTGIVFVYSRDYLAEQAAARQAQPA